MRGPEAAGREYSQPRGALPCIGCAPNYNSFSEAAAAGVRMWFLEHWALCHHRFNSESPLHWRAVGVLNPSRVAPDRTSLIYCKATGRTRQEELVKVVAFHQKAACCAGSPMVQPGENCGENFANSQDVMPPFRVPYLFSECSRLHNPPDNVKFAGYAAGASRGIRRSAIRGNLHSVGKKILLLRKCSRQRQAVRKSIRFQPGVPVVGAIGDYVSFIWAEIVVGLSAMIIIWKWRLRSDEEP
jgi:hypothetical protein